MKRKVLMIMNSLGCGGTENFVMNLYRCWDREKLQVDFLATDTNGTQYFENEIIEKGGIIYKVPGKNRKPLTTLLEIYHIVKNGHYNVVHRHSDNSLMALDLCAAAMGGAKVRIAHSHSSDTSSVKIRILHYVFRPLLNFIATTKYACGDKAGKWMFGKNEFKVIKNGIVVEKFAYNDRIRAKMRGLLNINEETILLGHVGRFDIAKNQVFLVYILDKLTQMYERDFKLVLIGDGPLKNHIREIVYEKKLEKQVVFVDTCNNVNEWLHAMDIFVFPSIYEGLPLSLIEAQASGTKCLISDSVTTQVTVTPLVEFAPLDAGVEQWAKKIHELVLQPQKRKDTAEMVIKSGYDIRSVATELSTIYEKVKS